MKTIATTFAMILVVGCGQASNNASTAQSAAQSGAIQELLSCSTGDGKYSLSVSKALSSGRMNASIEDADGNVVGTYGDLKVIQSSFSISFGHRDYIDNATGGKDLTVELPSTNTPFRVQAVLADGTTIKYGKSFNLDQEHDDQALNCR